MKREVRPNYRQERADYEQYQRTVSKKDLFFPIRIAFERMYERLKK